MSGELCSDRVKHNPIQKFKIDFSRIEYYPMVTTDNITTLYNLPTHKKKTELHHSKTNTLFTLLRFYKIDMM